jgi:3-oxoacyl-[acyl-carrier-protein] synthase-3
MLKSRFESLGCHMPEKVVTSKELLDAMAVKPAFDLVEITGIERRRYRGDGDDSLALGLAAARDCLARSKYRPEDLDAIIWTSITRLTNVDDFQFEPAISLCLKNALGATRALHFDLTNACAGMLTGVLVLDHLIRAGVVRNGLVVSGEVITHLTDTAVKEIRKPIDDQFASLTVGDSGAAVLMDRSPDAADSVDCADMLTMAEFSGLCLGMPSDQPAERLRIAMYTKALAIHSESVRRLPQYLGEWLTTHADTVLANPTRPFTWVIPHQTAHRVMTSVAEEMFDHIRTIDRFKDIVMPELLTYIHDFGNTSSTSHFVVLYHALKDKKVKPGDSVLLVPHASGIVAGFTFVRLGNLEV